MRMTPKKWLVAAGILCVLALAFFWGGERPSGNSESAAPSAPAATSTLETVEASPSQAPESSMGAENAAAKLSGTASADNSEEPTLEPSASPTQESSPSKEAAEASALPSPTPSPSTSSGKENAAKPSEMPASPKPSGSPVKESPAATDKPASGSSSAATVKPKPVEPKDAVVDTKKAYTATLSVTCKTILDNLDSFDEDKLDVLPKDGVIFAAQKVTFYEGESVFDVLQREMKKNKIPMEFSMTPIYNSNYVEGINNLYEFDCGELSGWMYKVNGWFPNYGSSRYQLKDGDVVDWVYTCDLGRDVGGDQASGAQK